MSGQNEIIFSIKSLDKDDDIEEKKGVSFVAPENQEPEETISQDPNVSSFIAGINFDAGIYNEAQLIDTYRFIALQPDVSSAIDQIADMAIVTTDTGKKPITLDLENVDIPVSKKKKMQEEFVTILTLMNFRSNGYMLFRNWYVDSRMYWHIIPHKNLSDGIQELRKLDPRKIKKVRIVQEQQGNVVVKDSYYMYLNTIADYSKAFKNHPFGSVTAKNDKFLSKEVKAIKIKPKGIAHSNSGLIDQTTGVVYGHLQKSIKYVNMLRMVEDALVIYRLARAPERRIFYIDVGNMAQKKADAWVRKVQSQYRNKLKFDISSGEFSSDKRVMSVQEDFFLPRREGNRGTEITTLPGGQNLGDIEDIVYLRNKLINALNVPSSRFREDGGASFVGNGAEITQEELRFKKFINRLRRSFARMLLELLEVQLRLKGIFNKNEFDKIKNNIDFNFADDSAYTESLALDVMNQRFDAMNNAEQFIGKYYSANWARKTILQMTDEEIAQNDKDIELEAKSEQFDEPDDDVSDEDA